MPCNIVCFSTQRSLLPQHLFQSGTRIIENVEIGE